MKIKEYRTIYSRTTRFMMKKQKVFLSDTRRSQLKKNRFGSDPELVFRRGMSLGIQS
jgi:hypothetical protein